MTKITDNSAETDSRLERTSESSGEDHVPISQAERARRYRQRRRDGTAVIEVEITSDVTDALRAYGLLGNAHAASRDEIRYAFQLLLQSGRVAHDRLRCEVDRGSAFPPRVSSFHRAARPKTSTVEDTACPARHADIGGPFQLASSAPSREQV